MRVRKSGHFQPINWLLEPKPDGVIRYIRIATKPPPLKNRFKKFKFIFISQNIIDIHTMSLNKMPIKMDTTNR